MHRAMHRPDGRHTRRYRRSVRPDPAAPRPVPASSRSAPSSQKEIACTWLDERSERWPDTINPHVFINHYTAVRLAPVSSSWISKRNGLRVQAIREDRILNEALAGADVRLLGDLFGLSVGAAERYTRVLDRDEQFSS